MTFPPLGIVIAGGGTGGHLNPGIAIAQEFMERNQGNRLLFIGTNRPLEVSLLAKAGFEHRWITAAGIKGLGIRKQAGSFLKIPRGIVESILMLKRFKPDLAVGVGGYSAGPVVLGAWLLGIRTVFHEQNFLTGMTNRMLAPFVDRIYVSFEKTAADFNRKKVRVTGNPVRSEVLALVEDNRSLEAPRTRCFTVFITGGSQGAHGINQAVMQALEHIDHPDDFYFIHQTGSEDEAMVADAYRRRGIPGLVQSFFDDMAAQYHRADLVVCRAGATTIAEVTTIGKAVFFVPLPSAADQHQVLNARMLKDRGAADMILEEELSGKLLMGKIQYYASNRDALDAMAMKARAFGRPAAAADIVDDCYRLLHPING
ncbi:MAG: undecaprenyldiphospho-muramoylpentapeptide beta-N-acetylglucosaminyltransferase [Desulfobacterales bacterium]